MTDHTAGPRAALTELVYSCSLAKPHLYTEQDVYGMEYFCWPARAGCPAALPPISCTPAHQPNMGSWKTSL